MIDLTSPSSGNLFKDFFEKINSPFKDTSNTPPPLEISSTLKLENVCVNSASKLEAFGR
tara:strand:+ start:829 stop:1005 length:177 start_codon:yes stop_codon:yes gene_type:complete